MKGGVVGEAKSSSKHVLLRAVGWALAVLVTLIVVLFVGRRVVLGRAAAAMERQVALNKPLPSHSRTVEPLDRDLTRVLSLDGGGIRGIITLEVLAALEEAAGKPTAELFDLIVGSSTGGIAALLLTVPGDDGKPRYSARELVTIYRQTGAEFFKCPLSWSIFTLGGVLGPKYPRLGLREHLIATLGDVQLSELVAPVLFPAFSDAEGRPYFFRSRQIDSKLLAGDDEYRVADAILAATTVPSLFFPAAIPSTDGKRSGLFLDGALYSPSPTLCGLIGSSVIYPGNRVYLISLGTGAGHRNLDVEEIRGWGLARWMPHILPTIMDANAVFSTEYAQDFAAGIQAHFMRIDKTFNGGWDSFYDVRQANIDALSAFGAQLAKDHAAEIDEAAKQLVEIGASQGAIADRYSR